MRNLTDETLLTLLERSPQRLERHLQRHPSDLDRLEVLTELAPAQKRAVESEVAAPADIAERVAARLRVNPSLREAGETFASLFTLGIATAKVIFEPPLNDGAPNDGNDQ